MSNKQEGNTARRKAAVSEDSGTLNPEQAAAVTAVKQMADAVETQAGNLQYIATELSNAVQSDLQGKKAAMALHRLTNLGDELHAVIYECRRIESGRKRTWSAIKREFINAVDCD